MNYIKKFLFFIADNMLHVLVYTLATATVLVFILGNRLDVKQAVVQSGAYQKFVPSIIEANKDQKEASSIPLNDPEVVRIINDSFPPSQLQRQSETILDSIFNWLEGSSQNVQFSVDFTENKNQLGDKLSEYAYTNLAFKETCLIQPEFFDPFTTICRPYGYDIFQGQKDFADQIKSSEGFLGKTVLTEQDLPKNKAGKNIFEQYSYAPMIYQWLLRAPYILSGLTILTAIIFVAMLPNKRRGFARLGRSISGNAVTLIVTPVVFRYVLPRLGSGYTAGSEGSSFDILLNDIVSTLTGEFDRLMIWVGIWLLLIGLAIILGERMTRPHTRYAGVETHAGIASSNGPKKRTSSPRGKLTPDSLPLQSSEHSTTKKPRAKLKNSRYRKIPL